MILTPHFDLVLIRVYLLERKDIVSEMIERNRKTGVNSKHDNRN